MRKILVFDLYNTLVEITSPTMPLMKLYGYYQTKFSVSNRTFREQVLTRDLDSILVKTAIDLSVDIDQLRENLQKEVDSVQPFGETIEILTKLNQCYPLYLVSNLASPYKQPVYDLKLNQFFQKMIFSCDVGCTKPQQQIFDLVPHTSANEVIMIGDSVNADIEGAKSMGWKHWWIQRGEKFNAEKRMIGNLKDLLPPGVL